MKKIKNSKKDNFLKSIPTASIDSINDTLSKRCKFNFSYMDFSQQAGQKFEDWTHNQLSKLLDKLKEYCQHSLKDLQNMRIGSKNNTILEVYGSFPKKSDFYHPTYVPHQAMWARFRLENKVRLAGFILPFEYESKKHSKTKNTFDCNTFYVVFLDANHRFYITKK